MNFRSEFTPAPFSKKIKYGDYLFLIGSCFTEEVGGKLMRYKFRVMQNPSGILFNPVSICDTIAACCENRPLQENDVFYHNELWQSWKHHSRFADPTREGLIEKTNSSLNEAHAFLKKADRVMITLGSAFLYETTPLLTGDTTMVVANCHKVPADKFKRRLADAAEVKDALNKMIASVKRINPGASFILTISPVRHLREGFVENNRSKAVLIQAVHDVADGREVFYFPSYELVIDDLRDYRFYAEDLAHPNYAATNYVFEKFTAACMDGATLKLMEEVNEINAARSHKPFHPASAAHRNFLNTYLEKVRKLKNEHPFLDLSEEEKYFSA